MRNHPTPRSWLALLALVLGAVVFVLGARGAAFAEQAPANLRLLTSGLSADDQTAQDLAVAHRDVAAYLGRRRGEVFNVFTRSTGCASGNCRQVNIYDFDANATISVQVDLARGRVESVEYLPESQPAFNVRLQQLAVDAIINAPEVAAAIGFRPTPADIEVMQANHIESANCNGRHICLATVFRVDGGVVWVMYDGTAERIDKIWWDTRPEEVGPMRAYRPADKSIALARMPEDCGVTLSYNRGGWSLNYLTMPTDGLEISNLTFNGTTVARSIKLVEWHAHYPSGFGYVDYTGCGGGGGGFAIYPYGNTEVQLITDNGVEIGFLLKQQFRMGGWPNDCNYRYEQYFYFFYDGRWRTSAWAYGRGCGNNMLNEATYRPVMRIDIDVNGPDNDSVEVWNGTEWQLITTEQWALQGGAVTPELYKYRIRDAGGQAYHMALGQGQFGDGGQGDNAYVYLTLFKTAEGANDIGSIGTCCNADYRQGPHNYVNGENIENANLVIWYVPQSTTVTTWAVQQGYGRVQYCWTDTTTLFWPCAAGPMFYPTQIVPTALTLGAMETETPTGTVLALTAVLALLGAAGVIWLRRRTAV